MRSYWGRATGCIEESHVEKPRHTQKEEGRGMREAGAGVMWTTGKDVSDCWQPPDTGRGQK